MPNTDTFWCVVPFPNREQAEDMLARVDEMGFRGNVVEASPAMVALYNLPPREYWSLEITFPFQGIDLAERDRREELIEEGVGKSPAGSGFSPEGRDMVFDFEGRDAEADARTAYDRIKGLPFVTAANVYGPNRD